MARGDVNKPHEVKSRGGSVGFVALLAMGWAICRRVDLWPTALTLVRRMARPLWYRRFPYLPVPTREYVEFRLSTAYGQAGVPSGPAAGSDLITYLEWAKRYPHV